MSVASRLAILSFLVGLVWGGALPAGALGIGSPAPAFAVKSGDDREINLSQIRGNVAIIFYEDRDHIKVNQKLKTELSAYFHLPQNATREAYSIPVVDCSGAVWPITGMFKSGLIDASRKEGFLIYGDWDGSMARSYSFRRNDSNVLLIDSLGTVRYLKAGPLSDRDISQFKAALTRALAVRYPQ